MLVADLISATLPTSLHSFSQQASLLDGGHLSPCGFRRGPDAHRWAPVGYGWAVSEQLAWLQTLLGGASGLGE